MIDKKLLYGPLYGLPDPQITASLDQDAVDASREDIAARILSLRPKYFALQALLNATAPVNKLPNEIIVEILSLANPKRQLKSECELPPVRTKDSPPIGAPCWLSLMLVCRHWYAIILANPRLWRAIDIHRSPKHFAFALTHSHRSTYELALHNPRVAGRIIPILSPLAGRFSKLFLPRLCCRHIHFASDLLSEHWPKLEALTILREPCFPEKCTTPLAEAPRERFPMLSTLRLASLAVSWDIALVSRLRRLELSYCSHSGPRMTLDAFLDVLEACYGLEELRLHNFLSTACSDRSSRPGRIVTLPNLKDFGFRDDIPLVAQLLGILRFSGDARIHIGSELDIWDERVFGYEDRSPFDLTRLLPKDWSHIHLPMSPILRKARVEVVGGLMRIVGMVGDSYLILDFNTKITHWLDWPMLLPDAVDGLVDIFGNCSLRELEIVGGMSHFPLAYHIHVLEAFDELEILRIEGPPAMRGYPPGGHALRDVCSALKHIGHNPETNVHYRLCPQLKSLSLVRLGWVADSMDAIRRLLLFRLGHESFLEELYLELYYEGLHSDDDFEAFIAPWYAELCELVPRGTVTMKRAV